MMASVKAALIPRAGGLLPRRGPVRESAREAMGAL